MSRPSRPIRSPLSACIIAFMLMTVGSPLSFAQSTDQVVRGIEVQGLERVDRLNVRSKIYTQVGRPLNSTRVSEDIKRIYRMNFFEDVQVATRSEEGGGVIVVFRVKERPSIVAITYDIDGDELDAEDLSEVVDLKVLDILDEDAIKRNLVKIQERYEEDGFYLVETDYELKRVKGSAVKVVLKVKEGQAVQVTEINIVGNEALSSESIKAMMQTKEGGYFSFLTKSGQFKEELLEVDIQRVQLFLLTEGYVEGRVERPRVSLSPDKRSMTYTLRVQEGQRYKMGKVDIAIEGDDWLVEKVSLEQLLSLRTDDIFNWQIMQEDSTQVGDVYRDLGYANTVVSHDTKLDRDAQTVDLTYRIQKGNLVYIRQIVVQGNKSTQDKVIRREMKISEGDLYGATKIKYSKARITSLGFFDKVEITPKPTTDPALIDLVVDVAERNTGTFQVGAGFSSIESFILSANISKQNFLGRGQTVAAQVMLSAVRQMFTISFTEPYFFDSRWLLSFDVFNNSEVFFDFSRMRSGGNLTWGYRFTDEFMLSLTYTIEQVKAEILGTDVPLNLTRQAGLTSSLRTTLSFDTRNNRLFPTKGNYTTLSVEYADSWLGSENKFVRTVARTRFYVPLFWKVVFKTNTTFGYVNSLDASAIPLFERFLVGGIFTVRGFERNSIGEKLLIADEPDQNLRTMDIGGTKELIFNAEIEIPIFPEVRILGVIFFDAGNAWGDHEDFNPIDLRTSMGFGVRWHSPVGPLRFEWGFPLAPRPGEEPMVFEFTIGNSF